MGACQEPKPNKLTDTQRDQIKAEIKKAAINHLNSQDANTAISHYTDDAIVATNTLLFPSLNDLSKSVKAYYNILKEVNLAVWDNVNIKVINSDTALFFATFRYSFTNTSDEKTDLKGVWTSLFVRQNNDWKIQMRHESVEEQKGE